MKEKYTRRDIQKIMTAAGVESIAAQKITARIIEGIAAAIIAGKVVELRGLGTLSTREYKERQGHNPKTMEPVSVPARRGVIFRTGGKLKKELRGVL